MGRNVIESFHLYIIINILLMNISVGVIVVETDANNFSDAEGLATAERRCRITRQNAHNLT